MALAEPACFDASTGLALLLCSESDDGCSCLTSSATILPVSSEPLNLACTGAILPLETVWAVHRRSSRREPSRALDESCRCLACSPPLALHTIVWIALQTVSGFTRYSALGGPDVPHRRQRIAFLQVRTTIEKSSPPSAGSRSCAVNRWLSFTTRGPSQFHNPMRRRKQSTDHHNPLSHRLAFEVAAP